MELDWRPFGLAVELQLDLDLDPLEFNGQIYVSRDIR